MGAQAAGVIKAGGESETAKSLGMAACQ